MQPLISIIMPVYNVEKYIKKAISSILCQTYGNFELLIINDGTKDNSVAIAEDYKNIDDRIQIFHKSNGGLSDARNYGLSKAKGDYIYFVDSDDWIEPNLLEVALKFIKEQNAELILFGYFLDSENYNGELLSSNIITVDQPVVFLRDQHNLVITRKTLGLMGYAWNKFYSTSFLNSNKLKFEKGVSLVEDILFNTRAFALVNKIAILDKPLYHYLNRQVPSLIKKFHINSFDLHLKKLAALDYFLGQWGIDNERKNKVLSQSLVSGIRYAIYSVFAFENDLNYWQKYRYIKAILNHEKSVKYVRHYQPSTVSDSFYKILINRKLSMLILVSNLIRNSNVS